MMRPHPFCHCADNAPWKCAVVKFGDGMRRAEFGILDGIGGSMKGTGRMTIDSNMVRVSIGTTLIKGNDDLGTKLADNSYQFAHNFGWISLDKGAWIVVFGRT